jgi:KDO2-lipid IV(A) lauroyltransferase
VLSRSWSEAERRAARDVRAFRAGLAGPGWLWNSPPTRCCSAGSCLRAPCGACRHGADRHLCAALRRAGCRLDGIDQQLLPRAFTTIYSNQVDADLDAWILAGRKRFRHPRLFGRDDGLKPVVQALRAGSRCTCCRT